MWSVLIVSDNKDIYKQFLSIMGPEIEISKAADENEAMGKLKENRYDFLFIDINTLTTSPQENRIRESIRSYKDVYPTLDIIVMSSAEMMRYAVAAVKDGASDYITYPLKDEEIRYVIKSIHESVIVKSELDYLRDHFWEADSLEIAQTLSRQMTNVYSKVKSVAPTISTVLLSGETGTGKGVMASLIHRHSNRRDSRFISVHCGAMPDTLLESELFGHEKGSFTGAIRRKLGKFEIASHGTIFLDEIGTITPAAQIKLLQVLQDGTIQRVGGEVTINTDVRIIVATNMDLRQMCEEGNFRKDLYYRLNVFPIEMPPLRERREDIPHFAEVFLKRMNRLNTKEIKNISPQAMEALINYSWPGNIRELENLIERAYILETTSTLQPESFPGELMDYASSNIPAEKEDKRSIAYIRRKAVEDVENKYLRELMDENNGKIKKSAEIAGISTRQLHKLLTKYGILKEEFKVSSRDKQ